MALTLTNSTLSAISQVNIQPNIALTIDGVDQIYTNITIYKVIEIGDELTIGEFDIGESVAISNQSAVLSMSETTTRIKQNINPDTGTSQSISSMTISFVDKDGEASQLVTPNEAVIPAFDLLGRKANVWLGFQNTEYKDDYSIIFRGIIDDITIGAGKVNINLADPLTKARTEIFQKADTELTASLNSSDTSCSVTSTADFISVYTPPAGIDSSFIKLYIRIDDEIIRYEGKTSTTFTSMTRGQLGTTAASHSSGAKIESFYRLTGDAMTLALKVLLSGKNGAFAEDVAITNFVNISPSETVSNAIFFQGVDLERDYGLSTGDYITTTGASNGANNFSNRTIEQIVKTSSGSYLVASGAALVAELVTSGTISFQSQYDTLGEGLALDPDQVDVAQFEDIFRLYLSSFNYDFYIKDSLNGKEFIEKQLFNPASAYGLPRNAQISVGVHSPPLPGTNIQTLDNTNVLNPGDLKIRRSTNLNFHNTNAYSYDELALDDKFTRFLVTSDADSLARIPVGVKTFRVDSKGMRSSLNGDTLAASATTRRLNKYKFGAEFIEGVKVNFKTGFRIEPGDIVLVDLASLQISDIKNSGSRAGEPRLFQVDNKEMDIRGTVILRLTDTNFDITARFGSISPASYVRTGLSATSFIIEESFSSIFGVNEFKKWEKLIGASIRVRNSSYSTSGTGILQSVVGNTITLASSLGFTPSSGLVMELDEYDNQPAVIKLIYAFLSDGSNNFADGVIPYEFF